MNIPTKITVTRIVLDISLIIFLLVLNFIPDLPIIYVGNKDCGITLYYLIAFIIFIIASTTDFLDGYLARKWKQVTVLGKFLDPVADKLLVDSCLIYLILPHFLTSTLTISVFCVIVMIARDLVVDAMRFIAAGKGKVLAANIFGKIKTVLQMVAISLIFLNGWPFTYFDASWGAWRIANIFVYLATFASFMSGFIYVIQNIWVFKEEPKK